MRVTQDPGYPTHQPHQRDDEHHCVTAKLESGIRQKIQHAPFDLIRLHACFSSCQCSTSASIYFDFLILFFKLMNRGRETPMVFWTGGVWSNVSTFEQSALKLDGLACSTHYHTSYTYHHQLWLVSAHLYLRFFIINSCLYFFMPS